jgi:intein/homing endonuclease
MAKLFGFSIDDNDKKSKSIVSPVPANNEDGVDHFIQSGFYGQYVDIEGVYRTEYDLIRRYREMALHPECEGAIESVVNEAIVSDLYDSPVEIELSNLNASDRLKELIRIEFKYIKEIMDFDKKCHEIFRNWYVDGRLFYLKVIDQKNPEKGIQELRYIDPMKMKHVRQEKRTSNGADKYKNFRLNDGTDAQQYNFPEIEEYFVYTPTPNFPSGTISGGSKKGVKIAKDSITYCTSGLVDRNKGTILSYLHKAIKALNQLRMIEDSLVIYRLCLIGDTRVKTDKGYSYIKDIQVGDKVYSYDNRVDKLVETTVSNKWLTGTKQSFRVQSKHHSVVGTDTHPVLVYDNETKDVKYVPIKDLQPKRHSLTYIRPEECSTQTAFPEVREKCYKLKDTFLWSSYKIDNKEKVIQQISEKTNINRSSIQNFLYGSQSLESSDVAVLQEEIEVLKDAKFEEKLYGWGTNQLNLPEYIDEEFARLFGFLIGDGCITKYGVTFAEGEDEIQNLYYSKLMEKFFGNCTRSKSNRKYSNYHSSNTLASELLQKLGFKNGAKIKRIPDWVFTSPNNIKREFILGLLDADGHYRDLVNGFSCEISLANKQLIEDIKEIWTSIGLCSGQIRHRIRPEQTRIIGEENKTRLIPETQCWELYLSEYELPKFEKIISVETAEVEDVYDIEVSHEKHNFVANGIVVHNSRAPERRIFYIDVGNLPKVKAEQYLKEVMSRYRNKLVYDANTGEIRDDRKFMSMLEDFWLPRREGGRGTEITTLPGGQNLGELSDIQYFQKKLYRALGVPESRIAGSGDGFNLGRSSEILRDELMFSKFVGRLRKKFANVFNDILRSQLILKNIVSPEDWEKMADHIQYDFLYDNHFAELKEAELMTNRLTLATTIEPYIGKYYSTEYIRKKILRQTDSEIIEIDMQIEDEINKGILPNPNQPVDEFGNPIATDQQGGVPQGVEQSPTGETPIEPSMNTSAVEIPNPKGGKI